MADIVPEKNFDGSDASYKESKPASTPNAVSPLNARRRAALEDIDNAKFSYVLSLPPLYCLSEHSIFQNRWYHVRTCLVAGVGFFTDAYDIFAISIAASMLGYVYGPGGALTPNQDLGVKVATPIGTLVGQL